MVMFLIEKRDDDSLRDLSASSSSSFGVSTVNGLANTAFVALKSVRFSFSCVVSPLAKDSTELDFVWRKLWAEFVFWGARFVVVRDEETLVCRGDKVVNVCDDDVFEVVDVVIREVDDERCPCFDRLALFGVYARFN